MPVGLWAVPAAYFMPFTGQTKAACRQIFCRRVALYTSSIAVTFFSPNQKQVHCRHGPEMQLCSLLFTTSSVFFYFQFPTVTKNMIYKTTKNTAVLRVVLYSSDERCLSSNINCFSLQIVARILINSHQRLQICFLRCLAYC